MSVKFQAPWQETPAPWIPLRAETPHKMNVQTTFENAYKWTLLGMGQQWLLGTNRHKFLTLLWSLCFPALMGVVVSYP